MGREPLGLPASGKVHTWLPWPTQRSFSLKPNMQAKQKVSGSFGVSVKWGRPWAKSTEFGSCAEDGQHGLPSAPLALELGMQNSFIWGICVWVASQCSEL
eukprot:1145247-Pelagomonas_calceolata.AAC.1